MQLQASLFGSPQFYLDGKPIVLTRRKIVALLTYLVITTETHSRDALATLFWPENSQSSSRANLRRELSRLRQKIGDAALHITRQEIAIGEVEVVVDVAEFQALVATAKGHQHGEEDLCADCAAKLQTAVSHYQDDFLAGFTLPDSPEFDEWQFFLREGLRQMLGSSLQKLVAWFRSQGAFQEGIAYSRRWLALDPLHEPAQRYVMQFYAWDGQQAAAIRQYQECTRLLDEELGIEPEPETMALFEQIQARSLPLPKVRERAQTAVSPSPPPVVPKQPFFNLPADPTPFVGREASVQQIHKMLQNDDCRLLTIIGLGGMGKSRLAVEAARGLAEMSTFADGIAFVSLASISTAAAIPNLLADTLDLTLSGGGEPLSQLIKRLRQKQLLLILDNYEHLLAPDHADQAIMVAESLLTQCPELKLLVTSREPLQMLSEWRLVLEGLPYPKTADISSTSPLQTINGKVVTDFSAVPLFVQTAVQSKADFVLQESNSLAVCRICELAQGMPLAIKLAATWLRAIALDRIVAEMERSLNILTTRLRDLPARQRSMRAIFDYSWDLLDPLEQALFQALSVFRGTFSEEAAAEIANASPFLLAGLIDRGLLQTQTLRQTVRYQMHELTRQYASERLAKNGQLRSMSEVHARHFAAFVQARAHALWTDGFSKATVDLTDEASNIQHAWDWVLDCLKQQPDVPLWAELLLQFGCGMQRYYYLKRPLQTSKTRFLRALEAMEQAGWPTYSAPHPARTVLARYQYFAAFFLGAVGEYEALDDLLNEALPYLEAHGKTADYAAALTILAKANLLRGRRALANAQIQESLPLLREGGDENGAADALKILGVIAVDNGDYEQAMAYYQESLDLYEKIGFRPGSTMLLYNMGTALSRWERVAEAKMHYRQSLELAQDVGYMRVVMQAQGALGGVNRMLGRYEQAEVDYKKAIKMAFESGDSRFYEVNIRGLGLNYLATNNLTAAVTTFKDALSLSEEMNDLPEVCSGMMSLAQAWGRQGNLESAFKLASFVAQRDEIRAIDKAQNDAYLEELLEELRPFINQSTAQWSEQQTIETVLRWIGISKR